MVMVWVWLPSLWIKRLKGLQGQLKVWDLQRIIQFADKDSDKLKQTN